MLSLIDEEDKENVSHSLQASIEMTSSKDTVHLLQISCILHILFHYWTEALSGLPFIVLALRHLALKPTLNKAMMLFNSLT